MTAGIFGLAGVLIGGLITWGIEWWREHQRLSGQVRMAARLMSDELRRASALLSLLEDSPGDEQIPRVLAPFEGLPAWTQYGPVIAREASHEAWAAVHLAYRSVELALIRGPDDSGDSYFREPRETAVSEAAKALRLPEER
jgi:hypothetical protein